MAVSYVQWRSVRGSALCSAHFASDSNDCRHSLPSSAYSSAADVESIIAPAAPAYDAGGTASPGRRRDVSSLALAFLLLPGRLRKAGCCA